MPQFKFEFNNAFIFYVYLTNKSSPDAILHRVIDVLLLYLATSMIGSTEFKINHLFLHQKGMQSFSNFPQLLPLMWTEIMLNKIFQ